MTGQRRGSVGHSDKQPYILVSPFSSPSRTARSLAKELRASFPPFRRCQSHSRPPPSLPPQLWSRALQQIHFLRRHQPQQCMLTRRALGTVVLRLRPAVSGLHPRPLLSAISRRSVYCNRSRAPANQRRRHRRIHPLSPWPLSIAVSHDERPA